MNHCAIYTKIPKKPPLKEKRYKCMPNCLKWLNVANTKPQRYSSAMGEPLQNPKRLFSENSPLYSAIVQYIQITIYKLTPFLPSCEALFGLFWAVCSAVVFSSARSASLLPFFGSVPSVGVVLWLFFCLFCCHSVGRVFCDPLQSLIL